MATAHKESKSQEQGRQPEQPRAGQSAMIPYERGEMRASGGWEPFYRLREEFVRLFDRYARGWLGVPAGVWEAGWRGWGLDVWEDDNAVVVRAEAPGFEPSDFDLQVRGDQLILRAAHKAEAEDKDRGYREWRRQEFYRTVPLPAGVDPDKVKANYRHGVLMVTLPKTETGKPRRITVEG